MSMEQDNKIIENAIKLATPMLTQSGKANELAKLNEHLKSVSSAPVCILICGEFKRGKSTFVNALIGRNLCATDTDICTSVVSIINYGEREKVVRYYGDFINPKSQEITLDDLERYTVGTAEEIDNTIYVEISLPLSSLKDGLMIIDTPGVGGLDPRHAALTNFFLPKADIALFVTDVNEPMTTTELNYYKNKVLPYAKQSMLIVNKSDLRDKESVEDFRLDTINKVASTTQSEKNSIIAVSVSSAAEAYPDSDLGESNFSELRSVVSELVNKHRKDTRKALAANVIEILDLAITPLKAQLQQIEQPNVDQIEELNRNKASTDRKLAELTDPNSEFRSAVTKEITTEREKITNFINEASVTLQSQTFISLLHSPQAKADNGGQWTGRMLNDAIAEIGSNVTMMIDSAFKRIAERPQFEGMLQFITKDYHSNVVIRDVDTKVPLNKRISASLSGFGIISMAAFAGLPGLLFGAAAAVASFVSYKNQKDMSNSYVENNLRQMYQPQMSGAINSMNTYVNTRFTEFQQEWLGLITDKCKAYKASLQESMNNIQQVKQAINQAVNMKMQIQNKLKPLLTAREMIVKAEL